MPAKTKKPRSKPGATIQIPFSSYYPLFEHMSDNHGLTLLDSEMEDIIQVVLKMHNFRVVPEMKPGRMPLRVVKQYAEAFA